MPAPVTVICGDVHHGAPGGGGDAFPAFLAWLATRTCGRLVILGDLCEYWLEAPSDHDRHGAMLAALRALRARGWRIALVRGNREFVAGRGLEIAAGCRLHHPALDLALPGGRTLRVVHGDRLCHDPGYRALAAWMAFFPFRWWQRLHPTVVRDLVARSLRRGSRGERPRPQGRRGPFLDPRRVAAAGRGADLLVAGHIHRAWRRTVRNVDLLLAGDWPPGGGHWVEIDGSGGVTRWRGRAAGAGWAAERLADR